MCRAPLGRSAGSSPLTSALLRRTSYQQTTTVPDALTLWLEVHCEGRLDMLFGSSAGASLLR
jgi:hypothetical protein